MRVLKIIAVVLLIILIGMQFFQPQLNTSDKEYTTDIAAVTNMPEDVHQMLQTSCYDCHSNNTEYPWYNKIAPVSYWLDNHLNDGKRHLNFSEFGDYTAERKLKKLKESVHEIKDGEMPLDSYLWIHTDAKLTEEQKQSFEKWVNAYAQQN